MSDEPDELHRHLLKRAETAEQSLREARATIKHLEKDPRTGFLREGPFMEHLDDLLRAILCLPGALKLLRGERPESLTDGEYSALYATLVLLTPTYPNPTFTTMIGISERTAPLEELILTIGTEVRPRLSDKMILGKKGDGRTTCPIPQQTAGHLGDRSVAVVLVEPPRVAAAFAKAVAEGVRNQTKGSLLQRNRIPFRLDWGRTSVIEALVATGRYFKKFPRASATPSFHMKVVHSILIEVTKERAENNCWLATAALQARLKHLHVPNLFDPVAEYLNHGESALPFNLQDSIIHASLLDEVFGSRDLDGEKLKKALEDVHTGSLNARVANLRRRLITNTETVHNKTACELLVLLTAHNRLNEF